MLVRIVVLAIGYLFGLIQTGYLISNFVLHDDLRKQGSGNSGATNALRVFGVKVGLLVFAGDLLKALIYCLILKFACKGIFGDEAELMMFYGGLGVVLGHCYPFYMNFKGGKGVSSSSGMIIAYDLGISGILLATFIGLVAWKRYVSLGSLTVLSGFAVLAFLFHGLGIHPFPAGHTAECVVLILIFVALCFYAHRANIGRLLSGTENKISIGKKEEK